MSLHELKEEKERQDRLADEFWAEVSLARRDPSSPDEDERSQSKA